MSCNPRPPAVRIASPRWSAVCCAAALAASLGGCGSSSSEHEVRGAWRQATNAAVDRDGGKLCSMLTRAARASLITQMRPFAPVSTCDDAAALLVTVGHAEIQKYVGHLKLISVKVNGDRATTTDSTGQPADHWVRIGGQWKLTEFR